MTSVSGADVCRDVAGCGVDRAEVDLPIRIDHDRHDHDHGIGLAEPGWILPGGRAQAAGGHELGNPLDERLLVGVRRLPTVQRLDDPRVNVDTEDVVAARCVLHRERQTDMAEADDGDLHASDLRQLGSGDRASGERGLDHLACQEQGDHRVVGVDRRRAPVADGPGELAELDRERLRAADRSARHLSLGDRGDRRAETIGPAVLPRLVRVGIRVQDEVLRDVVGHVEAALAGHGQGSALRGGQPVDVEDADHSVLELHDAVEEILVLGVDAALGLGVDPDRLRSDQVAHHVEVMRREVDDHPDIADARRKWTEPRGTDLEDASQLAGVEPSSQLADRRVEALDVADGQHSVRSGRGLDHGGRLLARCRDRLLDQDVGAGAQGREGDRQVEAGRRDDADEIEPLLREHPLRILVAARATARGGALDRRAIRIGNGDQIDAVDRLVPDAHVVAAHHAQADDARA